MFDNAGNLHVVYCLDDYTVAYTEKSSGLWQEQVVFTGGHTVRNPSLAIGDVNVQA